MRTLLKFLCLFFLVSCVGTIEKVKELNNSVVYDTSKISFGGIITGEVMGHDRVRLSFKKASGGSGNFSYRAYKDGDTAVAASVLGSDLIEDELGLCYLIVSGLTKGTTYSFQLKAYDQVDLVEDYNTVMLTLTMTTLVYPTFNGVNTVENVPGVAGTNSLKLTWIAATPGEIPTIEDPVNGNPYAIAGYRIYVGTSETEVKNKITAKDYYLPSVTDPTQTSVTIAGLQSATKYYIAIRAYDSANIREDLNIQIKTKSTLNATSPIVFAGVDVASSGIVAGQYGFSQINVVWDAGSGPYDHYRVYSTKKPMAGFTPGLAEADADITTTILSDINLTSTTLTNLEANSLYYVGVVACKGVLNVGTGQLDCISYAGHTAYMAIQTSPDVAVFAGLVAATLPLGEAGITSVSLNWSNPDSSAGYWEAIEIYSIDPALKANPPTIPSSTALKKTVSSEEGILSWTDENLTPGTEYCYMAKAVIVNYLPKRYDSNVRVVCATPKWSSPSFNGIKSSCSDLTPTGVTVSWATPSPLGTFHHYELYYREGTSLSASTFFTTCLAGDASCTKLSVALDTSVTTTLASLIDLSPGTSYQIGVKTYSIQANSRDSNLSLVTCTTSKPSVYSLGWFDIFSIGPKIDGRIKSTRTVIPEFLSPDGTDAWGNDCSSSGCPGNVDGLYKHRFPMERNIINDPDDEAVTATSGIVRLAWHDFSLSGSLGLLKDNEGSDPTKTGYNIYRMNWMSLHDSLVGKRPPLDSSAGSWGSPLNGANLIKFKKILSKDNVPGNNIYYSEWTDYTVDRSAVAADQTKIYFYKVEAVLNGKKLTNFPLYGDEVVVVILPPDNMAFVHRWMVNKEICTNMGRGAFIDRGANYRCPYNGMASTFNSSDHNWYYDMDHHSVVDRFEAGCNVDLTNVCVHNGNPRSCLFNLESNFWTSWNYNSSIYIGTASETVRPTWGLINAPTLSAPTDTVMYAAEGGRCYLNVGTPSSISTMWMMFHDVGTGYPLGAITDPALSPIGPRDSVFPVGLGLAQKFMTSNAKMPPLSMGQVSAAAGCGSFFVKHKTSTLRKRLPRLKESFAVLAPSPLMDNGTSNQSRNFSVYKLEDGTAQRAHLTGGNMTSNDRDCSSHLWHFWRNSTSPIWDDFKNIEPGDANLNYYPGDNRAMTGSSVDLFNTVSTEACISRYGLQDAYGNMEEFSSNQISCHGQKGCFSNKAVHLFATGSPLNSSEALDFTNLFDLDSLSDFKNSSGYYFDQGYEPFSYVGSPGVLNTATSTLNSMGYLWPTLDANAWFFITGPKNDMYISPALGLRLGCYPGGTRCASDDKILPSTSINLNNDGISVGLFLTGNNKRHIFATGGGAGWGSPNGRYNSVSESIERISGFRCMAPISD